MASLMIVDRRERALVALADVLLAGARAVSAPLRSRQRPDPVRRVLVLRLERIGDLLMTVPALDDIRQRLPDAEIDLVVGGWNVEIARALRGVSRVEALDAVWLARGGAGMGTASLMRRARAWRGRGYDVALNFEPDIRSNLVLASCGARWTAGYASGGGGPLLDQALEYDAGIHTTENARRLVAAVLGAPRRAESRTVTVDISDDVRKVTARRFASVRGGPLVGIHTSGGRAIKQWPPERFGEVARRVSESFGATIVLTGARADRALVDVVKGCLPADRTIDVTGDASLLALAAILERLDVLVTGDTGPMHLAATMGTPVVAVFGPSDPRRYAPLGARDRIVRVDLPCAPCNRIRLPPARCTGHTPDCLAGVSVDLVFDAVMAVLTGAEPIRLRATGRS
jgi:ADP-heptose:LPS heptosyltransferase